MLLLLIGLLAVFGHVAGGEDITEQYIVTSMELIQAMQGTDADEAELHQLAKDIVYHGNDRYKVWKLYDAYMEGKSDDIKEAFTENYVNVKQLEFMKKRLKSILGYYLTRDQIERVEKTLEKEVAKKKSYQDLIAAVETAVAKDIGKEKAQRAVEKTIRDLRLLEKQNVGWLEKASKLFFSLIKHDEH
ncbi:hypothetical protein V3C99_012988 [Haemonchus contortus]